MKLFKGDNIDHLKTMLNESIDAVITDPPYGWRFMGKKWDYSVPSVEFWKETLRVIKPGGHVLSFGGTRTYHRMVCNMEDAGFEIRDQLQWIFGSGFPKSHNLKNEWKGWGSALKPANEPIVLARKPLSEKTLAQNVLKHRTGTLNIDETRIVMNKEEQDRLDAAVNMNINGVQPKSAQGRWPANIIFDEEASKNQEWSRFFYCAKASKSEKNRGLEGMLDMRSGTERMNNSDGRKEELGESDRLTLTKNGHPTVKPIKLMEYLCKLITPPKGTILDPFMGSGSTGIAAKSLGFDFIGIELDEKYFEIAKKRIESSRSTFSEENYESQPDIFL